MKGLERKLEHYSTLTGEIMITPEIFRLYVDGKYIDYYGSLKRAEITARMYRNQGKTVKILEDRLDGTGSLQEVSFKLD